MYPTNNERSMSTNYVKNDTFGLKNVRNDNSPKYCNWTLKLCEFVFEFGIDNYMNMVEVCDMTNADKRNTDKHKQQFYLIKKK